MVSTSNSSSSQVDDGRLSGCSDSESLETAILRAIAYADVFDYPLTLSEVHRYLPAKTAPLTVVNAVISNEAMVPCRIVAERRYFALAGREIIIETRERRAEVAADMWPRALRYGKMIASLPYARMVAVTGALAVDNVEPGDDIDYLVVTAPGHLWVCRAMIIALVKLAARHGDTVCPNYLLSERALVFSQHNLFSAHEIAQMVPLAGVQIYRRVRQLNAWTQAYLPNAQGLPRQTGGLPPSHRAIRALAETLLRTPPGMWLEEWERKRKVSRLRQEMGAHSDAAFSAEWCKGHLASHGQIILTAYEDRLKALGIGKA